MAHCNKPIINTFLWMLICIHFSNAVESDINCLKSFKNSLEDPKYALSSWDFNNNTEGFICKFTGIDCWHPDESKVVNIRLPDMGLKGELPVGLKNCTSMTELDLSSNHLFGNLPTNISEVLKFVTNLDLSSNNFSSQIPQNIENCTYLNVLRLDNNQFSGQIPLELGGLNRIKEFSVANNQLSGQVPVFLNVSILGESYVGNLGLCGSPLPSCRGPIKKTHSGVIVGAAVGGSGLAALVVGVGMTIFMLEVVRKRKEDAPDGNKWAKSIKGAKTIKLLMFENSVSKM